MASNTDLVFKAYLDAEDVIRAVEAILAQFDRVQAKLSATDNKKASALADTFKAQKAQVDALIKSVRELENARTRLLESGKSRVGVGGDAGAEALLREAFPGKGERPLGSQKQLDESIGLGTAQIQKMREELFKTAQLMDDLVRKSDEADSIYGDINRQLLEQRSTLAAIQQLARAGPREAKAQIVRGIENEIRALQDQARQLEQSTAQQLNDQNQKALAAAPRLLAQAERHLENQARLESEINALQRQANQNRLTGLDLEKNIAKQEQLRTRANREAQEAAAKQDLAAKPVARADVARNLSGVSELYAEIQRRIEQLTATQRELQQIGGFEKQNAAAAQLIRQIDEILNGINLEKQTSEEINNELNRAIELYRQFRQEVEKGTREAIAGASRIGGEQMKAGLARQIPGLTKLFVNAFDDIQRRFVTTLQFAISGALIFGVQRFVREFFQAAIDVQRAFKDIESALSFDIVDERGTAAFNRQVEEVRQQVLLMSRDFNTLPTEANKAAYVMVSRFQNIDNALKATRSQLLATKISTIDQSEVLRALTAVSETFAGAMFDVNDGLTVQEKLLKREGLAADLYGRVLDDAVRIQQEFGVEVEDTLEGTARAAESFRQMGFSLQETEAIVASVSRQLGQTGQASSEKLVRSLAQLTNPQIRDALLQIADNSREFTLQISDFESGAKAWKAISDQFERIEKFDPTAAQGILQIIGQRREVEAVAAALGTADVQDSILSATADAAGAAEERFSFLNETVSELLASISAGFQELSQNFERLGGINALQLILQGLNGIIGFANDLLLVIIDIRDALDKWGLPIGTVATKVLSLTLAFFTMLKVAVALRNAFREIAATRTGAAVANVVEASSGTFAAIRSAASASRAASLASGAGGVLAARAAVSGAAAETGAKLGQMGAAAAGMIPIWGLVTVAVLGAVVSIKGMIKQADALRKAQAEYEIGLRGAAADAREQITKLGLDNTSIEADLIRQRTELEQARSSLQTAPSAKPGPGKRILRALGSVDTGADFLDPEDIPGSKEQLEQRIKELLIGIERNIVEQASQALRTAPTLEGGVTNDQRREVEAIIRRRIGGNENPLEVARQLYQDTLNEVADMLADETGTWEDRDLRRQQAEALRREAQSQYNSVLAVFADIAVDLAQSAQNVLDRLANLDTKVGLGQLTAAEAVDQAFSGAADLFRIAESFRGETHGGKTVDTEESIKRQAEAEAELLKAYQRRAEFILEQVANRTIYQGPNEQLQAKISALGAEIQRLRDEGGPNAVANIAEANRLQGELAEAIAEQIDAINQQTIANRQGDIDLAQTYAQRRHAMFRLLWELEDQLKRYGNDNEVLADALRRQIAQVRLDIANAALEEAIAENTARIKLAAPPLNAQANIEAQIAEVKTRLKYEKDATSQLQLQQQLRELQAQAQQQELERLKALKLAQVSVRDKLTELLVELSFLRQQLVLNAEIYGKASREYFDTARAIAAAKAAIQDAVLEAESVNRQLDPGFDVTDPLAAAREAYIRAARALQIPDLGEAERAAAELNLKNAEAARVAAEFESALFNLKFANEQGSLSDAGYLQALKEMRDQVDTSTRQGKEIWLEINALIEGMTDDLSNQAFNIPGQIRIPTLFEVRRAVQAEALGVNYLDNRQQNINVYVSDDVQVQAVFEAIAGAFEVEDARYAPGGAGITLGVT